MLKRQSPPQSQLTHNRCRAPVPRCWLMTDARLGASMHRIIARMPPRSAVVIRPYAMGNDTFAHAIRRLIRIARARRHWIVIARRLRDYRRYAGDGLHLSGPASSPRPAGPIASMAVHNRREAMRARRLAPAAVLISPVWATASHPGQKGLGLRGFATLARTAQAPAIVLGGASPARFRRTRSHGAHGWAAIDAWLNLTGIRDQKRNCVPT